MATIKEESIYKAGGLTVKVKKIPFGARWSKDCPAEGFRKGDLYKADRLLCGGSGKARGITVHNTDDSADAATYTLATFNQNMNSARVHFYVDHKEAWQLLELYEVGWHAGTGNYGRGNEDTIAVEIIMGASSGERNLAARENGAVLVAYLLKQTGLGIGDIHTHKEWNGKSCPYYLLPDWQGFLRLVREKYDELMRLDSSSEASDSLSGDNNSEHMCTNIVEADEYAKVAVEKAASAGILLGDGNGDLRPREPLTRQDFCVILDRLGLI